MCLPAAGNPASLVAAFLVHSSSFFPVLFHRSVICVRSDEAHALFFSFLFLFLLVIRWIFTLMWPLRLTGCEIPST